MPKKLEDCVKKIMEQGKDKSSAFAICTKAIGNDAVSMGQNKIDPHTGFMHTKVVICRSGIQPYMGFELGLKGTDAQKTFNVLRHPDDVTAQESIETYKNIIATDEHPTEKWIYADNVKQYQRGQVSEIEVNNDTVEGLLTITDQSLIEKVQNGKVEVSLGYAYKLVAEDGEYKGEPYQFKYTDIVANHLSVVEKGRCGEQCRIIDDNYATITDDKTNGGSSDMKIKINGQEFEVDEAVGKAIMAERAAKDAEVVTATKKAEDMEEEVSTVKNANDTLQAKLDATNEAKMTDSDINAMVADRAKLIAFATTVIGNDAMPESTDPLAVKTAVVCNHFGISVDGKSEAYIDARFDMVQEDRVATDESVKKLADDMEKVKLEKANDNEKVATDARAAYLKKKGL